MINISYLANISRDDFLLTVKILFAPYKWTKGEYEAKLRKKIKNFLLGEKVFLFTSARGALLAVLNNLGLEKGDEVIVQAFTCCAVVNPVISAGAKPVYVDIDKNYNIDILDLKKKISDKTKVIIVQHTFGLGAQIEEIVKIARKRNIFVIEDLAHSFGVEYKGGKLGSFADCAVVSFGRSKVASSMFGGAVVINGDELTKRVGKMVRASSYPSFFWTGKQLLHQIIFYLIRPFYDFFNIGKFFLYLLFKLKLTSREVEEIEKEGEIGKNMVLRMPNAQCCLALHQTKKLKFFLNKRKMIGRFYQKNLDRDLYDFPNLATSYLRFPVETKNKERVLALAKKRGIYLGDWYSQIVAPEGVNLAKMKYKKGECLVAERKNSLIINLPTNPYLTDDEVKKVVEVLNEIKN